MNACKGIVQNLCLPISCRVSGCHQVVEGEVNACKGIVQNLGADSANLKNSEDAKDIANRQVRHSMVLPI